jgi:regulator of protease activity HflC (stomatin/prohibitin superfamily)
MEKQIQAERERRSNVLRADGHRESKSIESRGYAAQMVLKAEGDKNASILNAKGRAEARKLLAQAEAQALSLIREAVAPFNMRGVDFSAAVDYLKTLSGLGHPGNSTTHCVLMPVDTVDTLGAIASGGGPARVA